MFLPGIHGPFGSQKQLKQFRQATYLIYEQWQQNPSVTLHDILCVITRSLFHGSWNHQRLQAVSPSLRNKIIHCKPTLSIQKSIRNVLFAI